MNQIRQASLFEGHRLRLQDAIDLSLDSLREYGRRYTHWATAYSGGKDSSATTTFIAWAIREGLVDAPETWTVMLSDTRMELPPLISSAMTLIDRLRADGVDAKVVMPEMDDRFFVYMFGRGVPPPKNRFRWCTPQLKIYPMQFALEDKAVSLGMGEIQPTTKNRYGRQYVGNGDDKLLMLTGVRLGESAARDQRIAISCSKDSGECGQGWFQVATPESLADTLAPLLHWRLCHVFDWLYFETARHGYPEVIGIADVYGDDEVRTGCVGCNLASRDTALERLLKKHPDKWGHLTPLMELKPLYKELKKARYRKRKSEPELRKDGAFSKNVQRLGPLTMEAREFGLNTVLDIQRRVNDAADGRPGIDLINAEEEARIRELWALNTWPNGWDGTELVGDIPLDAIRITDGGDLVTQPLLV
jgi:DNA sulfur modification protein DndC